MQRFAVTVGSVLLLSSAAVHAAFTPMLDGDYRMVITGGCHGLNSNCQTQGGGVLIDNATSSEAALITTEVQGVLPVGVYGSGISNDGLMGVVDFHLSNGMIDILSFSQDSLVATAAGTVWIYANDVSAMGGAIDSAGNMVFDPIGRMAVPGVFASYLGEVRWNYDDSGVGAPMAYNVWSTGSVTNRSAGPTPPFDLAGIPLQDAGVGVWVGTLVSAGNIGSDWGSFANTMFSEVYRIQITSLTEVPAPAAVWLLGSGVMALVGVARRRRMTRRAKPVNRITGDVPAYDCHINSGLKVFAGRMTPAWAQFGAMAVISVVALFGVVQPVSAASCAPGMHWVDVCTAGVDDYQVTMRFGIDTDFDAFANVDVTFSGVMRVSRSDPYASNPGASPGHLDRLDTEILSMELAGSGFADGWVMRAGSLQGLAPTLGFVQEQSSSVALSHFDMVFDFVGTPYGTLHHAGTFFFEASVDQFMPVGAWFRHTGSPFGTTFLLYDSNNVWVLNLEDQIVTDFVGMGRPEFQITATVVPVPAATGLFGAGLVVLVGVARKTAR